MTGKSTLDGPRRSSCFCRNLGQSSTANAIRLVGSLNPPLLASGTSKNMPAELASIPLSTRFMAKPFDRFSAAGRTILTEPFNKSPF